MADAEDGYGCPRAEAISMKGDRIQFGEHWFPDGSSDLAMLISTGDQPEIKRVTYGGGKTENCRYHAVILRPGGGENQWGWHLVWAGEAGLFYARMDGQAWVSSPPKRLGSGSASNTELLTNGQELRLRWHEQHGDRMEIYQAVSQDEGRSWEAPTLLRPAD